MRSSDNSTGSWTLKSMGRRALTKFSLPWKIFVKNQYPGLANFDHSCDHVWTMDRSKVTAVRGRRDDWRTQTDSDAVELRFSQRAATLNVPTPLVGGAHGRSCRFIRVVAFRPSSFLAILRQASPSPPRRTASGPRRVLLLFEASLGRRMRETGMPAAEQGVEKWTKTNATVVNLLARRATARWLRKVTFLCSTSRCVYDCRFRGERTGRIPNVE